jgi:hypothetical protein
MIDTSSLASRQRFISRMVRPDFTILGKKRRTLDHGAGRGQEKRIPSLAGSVGFLNGDGYLTRCPLQKKKEYKKKKNPFTT